MGDSNLFPVEAHVPEEMMKLFSRTEETMMDDVKTLKEWMKTQRHLPEILDDEHLRNFLLLNKCSVEKTKQKIDMFYTIRHLLPEMFDGTNPQAPMMKMVSEIVYFIPMSKLTDQMYRVFLFKIRNVDLLDQLNPRELIAYIYNFHQIRMKEDYLLGDIFFVDVEHLNLDFILKFTPALLVKIYAIYKKVYSMRVKGAYFINAPQTLVKIIVTLLKGVLKPKIFQRIHFCETPKEFYAVYPQENLPSDYGGLEKSCEEIHQMTLKRFDDYKERFDKLDEMKVDENLRPEKLNNDEMLGFYGNFKQLQLD